MKAEETVTPSTGPTGEENQGTGGDQKTKQNKKQAGGRCEQSQVLPREGSSVSSFEAF